jgi:hypothetical protein
MEDVSMQRLKLVENPEIEEGLTSAIGFLPVLRTRWEEMGQGWIWPGCPRRTAQRIGGRLCLSWRRRHAKRMPTVDGERRTAFMDEIRELLGRVPRGDVMNADETAFLVYMTVSTGG